MAAHADTNKCCLQQKDIHYHWRRKQFWIKSSKLLDIIAHGVFQAFSQTSRTALEIAVQELC